MAAKRANFIDLNRFYLDGKGVMCDGNRRVFSGDNVMMVMNEIQPDPKIKTSPLHSHPHEQLCYMLEGTGIFWMEDEEFEVRPGDVIHIPSNVPHGMVVTGDKPVLNIDIFTPIREDFL